MSIDKNKISQDLLISEFDFEFRILKDYEIISFIKGSKFVIFFKHKKAAKKNSILIFYQDEYEAPHFHIPLVKNLRFNRINKILTAPTIQYFFKSDEFGKYINKSELDIAQSIVKRIKNWLSLEVTKLVRKTVLYLKKWQYHYLKT